jgi:hypothetical protein
MQILYIFDAQQIDEQRLNAELRRRYVFNEIFAGVKIYTALIDEQEKIDSMFVNYVVATIDNADERTHYSLMSE